MLICPDLGLTLESLYTRTIPPIKISYNTRDATHNKHTRGTSTYHVQTARQSSSDWIKTGVGVILFI